MAANYFYVKSGSGVLDYNAAKTYSTGDRMVPTTSDVSSNVATARKWVWECTTGGTTNGAPTWPASVTIDTTTVTQNGVVFTARRPGWSTSSTPNWTFATPYFTYALSACNSGNHDRVYVSNNHNENYTASQTFNTVQYTSVLCVDDGAAPPTALATGAILSTTGSTYSLSATSSQSYWYGITFNAGISSSSTSANISANGRFEKCQFILSSTGSTTAINLGGRFINCDFKFSATGQVINDGQSPFYWTGGSLLSGGTSPNNLTNSTKYAGTAVNIFDGLDLTNASASINLNWGNGSFSFRNIKLPNSWSGQVVGNGSSYPDGYAELENPDLGSGTYYARATQAGSTIINERTIVRTGGANNGSPWSLKVTCTGGGHDMPTGQFATKEMVLWNDTVGSERVVTVEFVCNSATLKNSEAWIEVSYLGNASSTQGSFATSRCGLLATPADCPMSQATWTTTGLGSPVTQKCQVTITPQVAGFVHVRFFIARTAYSITYVDPMFTLTAP